MRQRGRREKLFLCTNKRDLVVIKSFDIELPLIPIGGANTEKINEKLDELGINDTEVISIAVIKVNPDPTKYFTHYAQRIFYRNP